jgi:hypothetical protein
MRLVMTLLARDEADVVDAQIAFHLHAGVDFVVATDHRSEDGTTAILERYEREGRLHLIREGIGDIRQAEWVTRMARLAATDFEADWVINADADEFWWPREGSLKDVLAAVPERFGVVRCCWRHFLPRPDDGRLFAERMTIRLTRPAPPGEKESIYHAHQKVAHRSSSEVVVEKGNHEVDGPRLLPLRGWHPVEVLHFSFRSLKQLERKGRARWPVQVGKEDPVPHAQLLREAWRNGRIAEHFASFVVDDAAVVAGLASGRLAVDTRLRDALRRIRGADGTFAAPRLGDPARLAFPHPTPREDAEVAAEIAALHEIDGILRAAARVEEMEQRIARLEREPPGRLHRLTRR